ncbi:Putative uncharacterized protein [Moritella viscosa]|uniref:Uncharacterized protein n=1 Tax=Moritella viscosa TaxID=80854 RepID=A0A1L0ATY7_9GAMM|nr:Putative uncharacterized protein [Moritella viscosa]
MGISDVTHCLVVVGVARCIAKWCYADDMRLTFCWLRSVNFVTFF